MRGHRSAIVCGDMPSTIVASELFGRPVTIDGVSARLRDLGIVRVGDTWRFVGLRTTRGVAAFAACVGALGGVSAI